MLTVVLCRDNSACTQTPAQAVRRAPCPYLLLQDMCTIGQGMVFDKRPPVFTDYGCGNYFYCVVDPHTGCEVEYEDEDEVVGCPSRTEFLHEQRWQGRQPVSLKRKRGGQGCLIGVRFPDE